MVSLEDVRQMAKLSKLSMSEEELTVLTTEMQNIIEFAHTINNAATDEDEDFDNINNLSNVFREDVVVPSTPVEQILQNAEDTADNCFLVKNRKA